MARKRMISPEIWESQDFSQLSDLAKIVFISLFSHADDEGRGRGDPTFIKNSTFPYDENRRVADIKSALSEIARRMSVQFYSVNGIEFYFMTSWERWQKVEKPSKSKLPPPPIVGVGGDIPNCDKFGEHSPTIPRTFPEGSPTNRRRIEENRKEDEEESKVVAVLGNIQIDCKPLHTVEEYEQAVKALNDSTWAKENLTHLSMLHKFWDKLLGGYYKDFKKVDRDKPKQLSADELNAMFESLNADKLADTREAAKRELLEKDNAFYENDKALRLMQMRMGRGEDLDLTALMKERKTILAVHGLTFEDIGEKNVIEI